jgi:hypothetical protein
VYELQVFDQDDLDRWVELSKPLVQEERRERYNLLPPENIERPEHDPDYRPLAAKDMVPATDMKKVDFPNLTNILATNESWAGRLCFNSFSKEYLSYQPPVAMEN